ncbi:hypothetical protein [Microbacterium sp.]|uniref:hypothetical protein n=1 Tax=Microbacterium sp. TaxID=51671 RepID=UPI00391DBB44
MSESPQVRRLLSIALEEFDSPESSIAAHVRRAIRIAALRKDYVHQLWLQFEVMDVGADKRVDRADPTITRIRSELDSLLGAEEGGQESLRAYETYERNRSADLNGRGGVDTTPIGKLEEKLETVKSAYDSYVVPPGLSGSDLYYAQREADSGRAKMLPLIDHIQSIVGRVRTTLHEFLVTTEMELESGQAQAGVFVRAQEYVNSSLAQYAPSALAQFVAAQDRLYDGSSEDLAHALTSCRRMIKSLADHLYPATNETINGADGVPRKMSDDQFRNRLVQYVRETLGKHGQGEVVQRTLDSLGGRLKSLDALASKGVHDSVSTAEAETCVVWTYLLAADLLRLADGSSALLIKGEPRIP